MQFTDLTEQEAVFLVRVVGQLPTESGAFPIHQKLVAQFNAQKEAETPAEPKAE